MHRNWPNLRERTLKPAPAKHASARFRPNAMPVACRNCNQGDIIYIGTELYLGHGRDDFRGGLAEVSEVRPDISKGQPTPSCASCSRWTRSTTGSYWLQSKRNSGSGTGRSGRIPSLIIGQNLMTGSRLSGGSMRPATGSQALRCGGEPVFNHAGKCWSATHPRTQRQHFQVCCPSFLSKFRISCVSIHFIGCF